MKSNTLTFIGSLLLFLVMYLLSKFNPGTVIYDFRSNYNSLIEPLEFLSVSFVLTTLVLLFFNEQIFKKWLRHIVSWYVPVAFLLILSGTTYISYVWPTRVYFAIMTGVGLVIVTTIFALVQRFRK